MSIIPSINPNRIIIHHDKDFTINLLTNLVQCKICSNILKDPHDCLCCNQTFCFSCISNYVTKNKKCPYDLYLTREEGDELILLSKLKPTSLNIVNIINNLKLNCINAGNGCSEELTMKEVLEHEKSCAFQGTTNIISNSPQNNNGNPVENSKTLSRCSSLKREYLRKMSIMSFNKSDTGLDPLEGYLNATCNINNGNANDKLDKIIDILHYLQICINKNTPKDKDFVPDTPKFNLSYSTNKQPDSNYNSNLIFQELKENIGNMAFTSNTYHNNYMYSQGEKILSEFENMDDRLSSLESHFDNRLTQTENSTRKIMEEQMSSLWEKIAENMSHKLMLSSSNKTINNPIQLNSAKNSIRPPSILHLEIDSSNADIQDADKQLCKLKSEENLHNKINNADSPSRKKVTQSIPQNISTSPASPSNFNLANRKSGLLSKNVTKNVEKAPDKLTEQMEKLEQNIMNKILETSENMKKYLNDRCVEEIKRNNFEVILDSSNLFVQKIDEVLEKLK